MRSLFLTLSAALLLSSCSASPVAVQSTGRYIIKLKPKSNQNSFLGLVDEANLDQLVPVNKIHHRYSPNIFNGLAGEFSHDFITKAAKNPDVEYIEADGIMHTMATQANPPSWGLTRIGVRYPSSSRSNGSYNYPDASGAGVDVYVIDTGIKYDHTDFEGRATYDKSFVPGEKTDGNGHGTHCAGTIASKTYGVAKKVKVHGVQVLSKSGSGTTSGVIDGFSYACNAGKSNGGKIHAVVSMSLGGSFSQALNDAVLSCTNAGVVVVVAAGNESQDACDVSPASAPSAITVGATTDQDMRADFSNYGSCVDVYAPGLNIKSLWKGANGATNTISGTSMATPHVAGIAATYLSLKTYTNVEDVRNDIVNASNRLKNEVGKGGENECRVAYVFNEPSTEAPIPPTKPEPQPEPQPDPEPEPEDP